MRKYITLFGIIAAIAVMFTDCKKTTDPINANVATVTFINAGPKFVTDNITVNPKDSIQFQYTVTSPVPMATVALAKNQVSSNTVEIDAFKDSVKTSDKLTFTVTHKMIADSISGIYNYNVVARDINGVYVGSSKVIIVTVLPDFYYYTNLQMFAPDTTAKINPCYYSSSANTSFSYTSAGAANSAKIDFGFFFNTDSVYATKGKPATGVIGPSIYALNLTPTPSQISFNDISSWTKNATLLKVGTTPTFASLTSGGAIKQGYLTNVKSAAATSRVPVVTTTGSGTGTGGTRVDSYTALTTGSVMFFKTADGRYGALTITFLNLAGAAKTTYINFEVKVTR
jgi:hypothetical protein